MATEKLRLKDQVQRLETQCAFLELLIHEFLERIEHGTTHLYDAKEIKRIRKAVFDPTPRAVRSLSGKVWP